MACKFVFRMKHMVVFATVTFLLDNKKVIWDKNMWKCQAK